MRSITWNLFLGLVVAVIASGGCGSDSGSFKVVLTADDQMKFDQTTIEVPAGAQVSLTLKHVGKMSAKQMGHNFVLLDEGTDLNVFALAAASAIQTEYIPANQKKKVIAHTRMLGGGESDTVVFTAPAPGTYKFICSFPGHYTTMRGDFVVG